MYAICLIGLLIRIVSSAAGNVHLLHIGALFNSAPESIGNDDLQAAEFAVQEINQRSQELFHGQYQLKLLANHTQCDPIYAVDAFFHAIFRRPQLLFLLGTSCSNETKAVLQVANYYNLILFSHSTSFISQVNQSYSTLVRLSVSDENYNDARVALVQSNNWSHVAIIHQDSIEASLMMAKLAKKLNESNITVILTQSASMMNLTSALRTLQEKKARIVFVNFDTSSRAQFFCEVYRTFPKILRERYVWIFTGQDHLWWSLHQSNCTRKEILLAAQNHLIIDSAYDRRPTSIKSQMSVNELQEKLHRTDHLDRQTLHAYDAIWVIALLIRASIEHRIPVEKFSYESIAIRDQWLHLLQRIHFLGVSGPVSFRSGQRRAETVISQFQLTEHFRQEVQIIAEYSQQIGLDEQCHRCRPLIWTGPVPVDTERIEIRRVMMGTIEIALIAGGCLLGMGVSIFFLIFNIIHRHERYIKLSSPNLNNVMLIGAIHIDLSCLCMALDKWFLQSDRLGWACMFRIFLFSGGFSLTFGSMFLKTLRVYRIFTSRNRPLLHSKLLQDHHLLLICFCLYTIDLLFALIWQFSDPHSVQFTYQPNRQVNVDLVVRNEIYYCHSHFREKILPFLYLYKSLFLIMGGYLAAKTRHVHIPALNDSKFIVWSIYVVVLTSLFTGLLMISIKSLQMYVVICLVVIIMTNSIVCLVFLPKVLRLKSRHQSLHEVVSRDLMVDHSRTRRLVIEISFYEKYRYAQLQNRELKNELMRLTHLLQSLEQKFDPLSSNVALALLPIAVRWASNFLHRSDMTTSTSINLRSPSQALIEVPSTSIRSSRTSTLVYQSPHEMSSLPSTVLHSEEDLSYASEAMQRSISLELRSFGQFSEKESVLFSYLSDELRVNFATFDSDLDSRIDGNSCERTTENETLNQ